MEFEGVYPAIITPLDETNKLKEEEFSQNKLTTLLLNIIQNKEDYLRKKKSLENFCYQNNWNDINEKLITCLNEN